MGRKRSDEDSDLARAVAELQRVNAELADATEFLDAVVENIPDMIFVKRASDHMFIRFNRAGEELLGWTRAELLGKTDHDFYPKKEADFFHEKDRETFRARKLVDIPEEPITTKSQGLRWLHTKKVPVYGKDGAPKYLLGISEDITARKEAEARARALERELASVVHAAREAIVTWNLDGVIVTWNAAAETLYGLSQADAIGRRSETLLPEEERAEIVRAVKALIAGASVPMRDVWRRRASDGVEIEVEESLFLIRDSEGKPVRVGSIARDIGELARLRRATEILGAAVKPADPEPRAKPPRSAAMSEALAAVDTAAADANATVLLLGETGVGKGYIARRIHAQSPRRAKPFFEINCASLSAQLMESELFGHERGAFTGAVSQKRGLVEVAEGGTLFLDEIGELPSAVQAQLLTFLDGRTFRRVGGVRTMTANVRILAATNVDLKAAAERGAFRKDLFYRLSVFPVTVPPLRERSDEIPGLAASILRDLATSVPGHEKRVLSKPVLAALARYEWPGNVRELRNTLERALILSRGAPISEAHLPAEIRAERTSSTSLALEDVEARHIERVLAIADGNRTRAAELLGISRSTLKRKLNEPD